MSDIERTTEDVIATSGNDKVTKDTDVYFLGYNMLVQSLKEKDAKLGLEKAFYFAKVYFDAEDIILYRMENNDEYVHYANQRLMKHNSHGLTNIINRIQKKMNIDKRKEYRIMIDDGFKEAILQPIAFDDSKYIVVITNPDRNLGIDYDKFMNVFQESLTIFLRRLEDYNEARRLGVKDALTNLDNRNRYEKKEKEIDHNNAPYIYVLLDLFNLKGVNDEYNHDLGDEYIKKTAEILKRYFPKNRYREDSTGKLTKTPTGTSVYRIGGDEFAVITSTEREEVVKLKLSLIREEVKDLELSQPGITTGINFGVAVRKPGQTCRELLKEADEQMKQDKKEMYEALGLERRTVQFKKNMV